MRIFVANHPINPRSRTPNPATIYSASRFNEALFQYEITGTHYAGDRWRNDLHLQNSNIIVIYGGSTFHKWNPNASYLIDLMKYCIERKKPIYLFNSIFHMDLPYHKQIMDKCKQFWVRDIRSYQGGIINGQKPTLTRDPILNVEGGKKYLDFNNNIVVGGVHPKTPYGELLKSVRAQYQLDIEYTSESYEDIVASLKTASLYITAQPQGIYASISAGIPFIPIPYNHCEVESIVEFIELSAPICQSTSQLGEAIHNIQRNDYTDLKLKFLELPDPIDLLKKALKNATKRF